MGASVKAGADKGQKDDVRFGQLARKRESG